MKTPETSRRKFLYAVGGVAMAVGAAELTGCGGSSTEEPGGPGASGGPSSAGSASGGATSSGGSSAGGFLPSYIPRKGMPEPDIESVGSAVPAVYYAYPKEPVQLSSEPPLDGDALEGANAVLRAPVGMGKNSFWQELNKRLGVTLNMRMVPASEYAAKAATMVAGGDLPDFMPIYPTVSPASYPDLLEAKFEDLTPYLAGDAIAEYPNLAALPTVAWKAASVNGRIYSMPYTVPAVATLPTVRQDIFDSMGLSAAPADGAEFLKLCDEITDVKSGRWAFGSIPEIGKLIHDMAGVPNQWRVEDGKFISQYVTDEYRDYLSIMSKLWKNGYFEPDAPVANSGQRKQWFNSGRILIRTMGYAAWYTDAQAALPDNPDYRLGGLLPPKWDGGGQSTHSQRDPGSPTTTLKKAPPNKIKKILKLLDFLASPFGSAEYLFNQFGVAGQDYTLSGSDPVETNTGVNQCQAMNLAYVVRTLAPVYLPGLKDMATSEQEFMAKLEKVSAPLPTIGLISPTELAKGASAKKRLTDLENDIILGRKSVSSWDGAVKTWQSSVGEKISQEYAAAHAEDAAR